MPVIRAPHRTTRPTSTPQPPPSSSAPHEPAHVAPEFPRGTGADVAAAALLESRTISRSDGPEGTEPLVTAAHAARAERAFRDATPATRARLTALLASLPSPTHRALLLKAIAARATQLAHAPDPAAPLSVLTKFAQQMAPLTRAELVKRATSLDLDSRANTSAFDPQTLWEKRGTIRDTSAKRDTAGDNDGLFQRFTASCGPTTLQLALAEADPVFAFALHDGSAERTITSDNVADAVARFQRALLEAQGGTAIDRRAAHLRARYRNALGRYGTLAEVRKHYDGFPTDAQLARINAERWPERDEGIGTDAMLALVHAHLTPLTGVVYEAREFARGGAARHFDDVARALRRGIDLPFGLSEPGHWMLLTAVDGRKPKRRFLVSDPDGGRTAWVEERSFARGTFATDAQFHLNKPGERPYVDSFMLPRGSK